MGVDGVALLLQRRQRLLKVLQSLFYTCKILKNKLHHKKALLSIDEMSCQT